MKFRSFAALLADLGRADDRKHVMTHAQSVCRHVAAILENAMGGCSGAVSLGSLSLLMFISMCFVNNFIAIKYAAYV